jgi:anaerobic ribonucleoside-triphosphate reductase
LEIKKRDGSLAEFKQEKITLAIFKAAQACGGNDFAKAERLCEDVCTRIESTVVPTVEYVQNLIEKVLMEHGHTQTARAFILYREKHKQAREKNALIGATIGMFNDYLEDNDWRIQENANTTRSISGLNNFVREEFTKNYWLHEIYPNNIRQAHEQGDFHIHDLGFLGNYCNGWSLQQLLQDGWGIPGKVNSNPAKHLRSFLGQIVNSTFTTQGESSGAQAWSNFDTLCAPFIRQDKLDYGQVKQALQEFVYNLNVPTRVGGQCPFSNITMDITPPNNLKDVAAVIGGQMQPETYGDYQAEMNTLNQAFCEVMLEGDSSGRGMTFPIPVLNITKTFPWESKTVLDYMRLTGKYGSPYLSNYINTDNSPDDAISMCPLDGATEVITKSMSGRVSNQAITTLYTNHSNGKHPVEVFHKGNWYKAKFIQVPTTDYVKITMKNGAMVTMSSNHEQVYWDGEAENYSISTAENLQEGMWLPFNTNKVNEDNPLEYNAGYAVGAYMGDGYIHSNSVIYCLGDTKLDVAEKLEAFWASLGTDVKKYAETERSIRMRIETNNNYPKDFIEHFIRGDGSIKKALSPNVWKRSASFQQGVLDGWFATDGGREGNLGKLTTSSKTAGESFAKLCVLLGEFYKKDIVGSLSNGFKSVNPSYTHRIYQKQEWRDIHKNFVGYKWGTILKIEKGECDRNFYCAVVDSPDHLFTLSNGIITHNCRLRLSTKELKKRGGGLFGSNPLTGSIGVVTLNLPRAAKGGTPDEFLEHLRELSNLAKDSLEIKRRIIEEQTRNGLYPYSAKYLKGVFDRTGEYWSNHFNTIGVVGMNEACIHLFGDGIAYHKEFAEQTLEYLRDLLLQYQEETGHQYNLEATPAEGTCYSLAKKDGGQFVYYTNSTNLPVGYTDNIFTALDHQDKLQSLYTGGTVQHLYLGERIEDPKTCAELIKVIFTKYKLPYISITPTFSVCGKDGYLVGNVERCPKCGSETEVWSRVTGYLRPVKNYNTGKKQEFKERLTYDIKN